MIAERPTVSLSCVAHCWQSGGGAAMNVERSRSRSRDHWALRAGCSRTPLSPSARPAVQLRAFESRVHLQVAVAMVHPATHGTADECGIADSSADDSAGHSDGAAASLCLLSLSLSLSISLRPPLTRSLTHPPRSFSANSQSHHSSLLLLTCRLAALQLSARPPPAAPVGGHAAAAAAAAAVGGSAR
jgi:hypothetical protein